MTQQHVSTSTLRRWRILQRQSIAITTIVILCLLPFLVRGLPQSTAAGNSAKSKPGEQARLSDAVSVQARGRGNPTINLSDGREMLTAYVGRVELQRALEQNLAEPLSLASADFNEDGVPDLVSGYSYNGQGIVTLLLGNVDSIYPNAPDAQHRRANATFTDAPFLSPARVFAGPVAADFIGAGDFDADGHWDIVSASRLGQALYLLAGDGHGGFAPAQEISLPGVVTAMTTGEVNRRDGLTDVVVGITNERNSEVLVFEGASGALRAEPERFDMPAEVSSLALGQLDERYTMDLAVTAGNQLIVLAGRDRKLSLDENQQATVSPALRSPRIFASRIRSMTLGDFTGGSRTDVALLMDDGEVQLLSQGDLGGTGAARKTIEKWNAVSSSFRASSTANQLIATHTSGSAHDDLLITDASNSQLHVLTSGDSDGTTAAAARVTSAPLQLNASLDVTGAPVAVLPMRLNADALSDLVVLRANQSAASIMPTAPATTLTVNSNADTNDGACNATPDCTLREAINAANASLGADTISFSISGVKTITPLSPLPTITDPVTIDGMTQPGFAGTPIIELDGTIVPNGTFGLLITGGSTTVRGLVINRFDGGPGPAIRFQISGGNVVEGNFLGTDITGTVALGNGIGVFIDGTSNNLIGGTTVAARNLISGNSQGIFISGTSSITTTGNLVLGNFIGTDAAGTADLGNTSTGVVSFRSVSTIGGTVAGARNIISGNGNMGILFNSTSGALVQGNFIGTDVNGTVDLGNSQMGVQLPAANPNNTLGGTTPAARNVVSGNNINGFQIRGAGTDGNLVQGNFIGTNAQGTAAISNLLDGVSIESSSNTIGGDPATAGNRNIISGNGVNGISVFTNTGITVQNNFIGTDVTGNNCLGNGRDGVFVNNGSVGHTIANNLIACNGRNGVNIPNVPTNDPGIRIFLDNNFVFANGLLGIDLGDPGITPNDFQDPDGGANLQQNFPVLTSFAPTAPAEGNFPLKPDSPDVAITVNATLNSTPNTTFTVHWYFSSDSQCATNQQGSRPLVTGKKPGVTTDNNGNASFNFPFDFPVGTTNGIINCTATDPQGNTSEFSACLLVNSATPPAVKWSAASYTAGENIGSVEVMVTRTGSTAAAASVDYATSDTAGSNNCNVLQSGKASSRCDYETTVGTLRFAAGETSKTLLIPVVDDVYAEGDESFTVTLSNASGVPLGSPSVATVTINDNETTTGTNPINVAAFFVRLHYIDFLNREPDASGLAFWSDQITSCGTDQACVDLRRINVSAAFFLSIEFQETGYLVERVYRAAYGNGTGTSTFGGTHQLTVPVIRFSEFLPDTQQIGQGVVVGKTGWELVLENNTQAFMTGFVQRPRFTTAYPGTMSAAQFVDALNTNAGDALSVTERNQLVNDLTTGAKTRAQVLRAVAEDADLNAAEFNRAFVLMQFYGYLRRNPNDAPDADYTGYDFWLGKLNQFNGNFVNAEMVKAFIVSGEYKARFGP